MFCVVGSHPVLTYGELAMVSPCRLVESLISTSEGMRAAVANARTSFVYLERFVN